MSVYGASNLHKTSITCLLILLFFSLLYPPDFHLRTFENVHGPVLERAPDDALLAGNAPFPVDVALETIRVPVAAVMFLRTVDLGTVVVGIGSGELLTVMIKLKRVAYKKEQFSIIVWRYISFFGCIKKTWNNNLTAREDICNSKSWNRRRTKTDIFFCKNWIIKTNMISVRAAVLAVE